MALAGALLLAAVAVISAGLVGKRRWLLAVREVQDRVFLSKAVLFYPLQSTGGVGATSLP
jgi:hypothetical protein